MHAYGGEILEVWKQKPAAAALDGSNREGGFIKTRHIVHSPTPSGITRLVVTLVDELYCLRK